MARLRKRQKEEIIQATLKRVSPAVGGSAPGPITSGVSSYNGRTGAVVTQLTDVPAHASTHQPGGTDAMAVDAVAATGSLRTLGAGATQAASGADARLSDARTPLAHTHPESDVVNLTADLAARVLSTDSRLSDARIGKGAYDPGTITLSTDQFLLQDRHLYLTGIERLTATGTAEVMLSDFNAICAATVLGSPKNPSLSFIVPTEYFFEQLFRIALSGQMRATLQGTADLLLDDDFKTRSRIVLAGTG